MSIRLKTGKAILWSAAQGWGSQLISFFIYALLARFLSPVEFGLVAMAMVFVAFTQIFVDQGLSLALVQRKDITESHKNTAFWSNVFAGVVLTIIGIAAAKFISGIYKEPKLEPVLVGLSITLVLNSFCSVQTALFKRNLEYRPLALATILNTSLGGFVGIYMALNGYGVWSLVGQQLTGRTVHLVCLWVQSDWRPAIHWSLDRFLELYKYGISIFGINITEYFSRYADNFLIGIYLGPESLGYYALAYKFYRTLIILLGGLSSQVAFSAFSSIQNNLKKIRSAFYEMIEIMGFVAFPIFAGAAVLAAPLFNIMFGDGWDKSVTVFQVLMLVCLLESVFLFNGSVMLALGKPHWRFKLNLINSIANIVGFYIAVDYGIEYVACAYVVRSYLLSPLSFRCVKTLIAIDFKTYFTKLIPSIISIVIMAAAVTYAHTEYFATTSPFITIFSAAIAGVVVYLALAITINRNAFNTILSTLKNTFFK